MKHLASFLGSTAGALLLAATLVACNSPESRTPTASSGDTPFAGNSTATDPSAAAQRIAANPNVADSLHLLSPGQAGRLLIKMPEKLLLARVSAEQLHKITRTVGDSTYPAYEMRDAQQPSAPPTILEMAGNAQKGFRLRRIIITDPQYRTGEGIGVGSPFGVARQTFGLSRVRMTPEGFAAVSRQTRMAWLLDENSLPAKHPTDMATAEIPTATRIKGVILF
ncbi:hypothetical protein [Hymenobacter crusticola]|uniref:Uncharacterized protein n=1 Tax=Hymenobacter crusticola TaxID=1770526 RepID=A0A243WF29_9BACT|nr:hypothetical protein [Hymenobacter crusticola]OUJ74295.1 hypothetical protein BXP70_11290 [Hymenobacter crusticola]